jgi:tRNA/tmRNA/rRNA uracil-C5-methylase (TrmA/RlmC/RlmD family)
MKLIKLKAEKYNSKGEGIAFYNKKPFYIPGLLIGEEATCKVILEKEKFSKAIIITLLNESPYRNHDVPDNHLIIGGYEVIHMNREQQTKFKVGKIKEDFLQIARYEIKLEPMVIGEKQFRYRNKITLHDGGFYKIGTHDVIKMNDFLLSDIRPKTKLKGEVVIRKLGSIIEGHKKDRLYTHDKMMGLKFRVGINSFYQVNKEIAVLAYRDIMRFLNPRDIVFDLYSGIGTISLLASKKVKKVIAAD